MKYILPGSLLLLFSLLTTNVVAQEIEQQEHDDFQEFCQMTDPEQSLGIAFLSPGGVVIADGGLQTTAQVQSQSQFKLGGLQLYLAIYQTDDLESDSHAALPVAMDVAHKNLTLEPGETKEINVTWRPPEYIADGNYRAVLYASQQNREAVFRYLLRASASNAFSNGYIFSIERENDVPLLRDYLTTTVSGVEFTEVSGVAYQQELMLGPADPIEIETVFINPQTDAPWRETVKVSLHSGLSTSEISEIASSSKNLRLLPSAQTEVTLTVPSDQLGEINTIVVRKKTAEGSQVLAQYVLATPMLSTDVSPLDGQLETSYVGILEDKAVACWRVPGSWPNLDLFSYQLTLRNGTEEQVAVVAPDRTWKGEEPQQYITHAAPVSASNNELVAELSVFDSILDPQAQQANVIEKVRVAALVADTPITSSPPPTRVQNEWILLLFLASVALLVASLLYIFIRQRTVRVLDTKK